MTVWCVQRYQMKFSCVTDGAGSCVTSQVEPSCWPDWILRELLIQAPGGGCSLSRRKERRLETACMAITFCAGSSGRRLFPTARCHFEHWAWHQPFLRRSLSSWRTQMVVRRKDLIKVQVQETKKYTLKTSPICFSGKLLLRQHSLGKTGFKPHLYQHWYLGFGAVCFERAKAFHVAELFPTI